MKILYTKATCPIYSIFKKKLYLQLIILMLFKNLDSFHCPKCQKRQIQICILPFPINQLPWTMFHVPYSMFHLLFTNFHVPLMIYHLHFTIYHFPCSTYDLPLHFIFYHLPFTIYQLRFNIYPKSQDSDRE